MAILSQAGDGLQGVSGGPRGTRRTESSARQNSRAAVLNLAGMVAS
jgi:hypothetical protein